MLLLLLLLAAAEATRGAAWMRRAVCLAAVELLNER
jgi:hypothetical protein